MTSCFQYTEGLLRRDLMFARPVAGMCLAAYGRIPEVVARLEAALAGPEDLTTTRLAYELGVAHTVARAYLTEAARQLTPRHQLVARSDIAGLLERSGHDGTAEQRRERVNTLLHRKDAPRKHITVGGTDYYEKAAIDRLLSSRRDS